MKMAPHTYVQWWPLDEPHGHLLMLGDLTQWFEYSIEDAALELAETVQKCNPGRHSGHGRTHSTEDAMDAYRVAIHQLLTVAYEKEWADLQWNKKMCQLWGSPAPTAIIFPDEIDSHDWRMMIPNKETGMPETFKVESKEVRRMLAPPEERKTAVKGRFGWEAIPPDSETLPGKGITGPK